MRTINYRKFKGGNAEYAKITEADYDWLCERILEFTEAVVTELPNHRMLNQPTKRYGFNRTTGQMQTDFDYLEGLIEKIGEKARGLPHKDFTVRQIENFSNIFRRVTDQPIIELAEVESLLV